MVTGHAGLAVGASGEIATLLAHAAVHACAVAITLASCKEQRPTMILTSGKYSKVNTLQISECDLFIIYIFMTSLLRLLKIGINQNS